MEVRSSEAKEALYETNRIFEEIKTRKETKRQSLFGESEVGTMQMTQSWNNFSISEISNVT